MDTSKYLNAYIKSAHTHGEETVNGENYRKINRAYDSVLKNFKNLIITEEGKNRLIELLDSSDEYVSSWTASLMIFDYPKKCEPILLHISQNKGVWASNMRTFLEEWNAGNLDKMY